MNDILVKVGADISDFSRKMAESNRALQTFSKTNQQTFESFKTVGKVATTSGAAIAGGLGFAVKKAADFESGMSKVAAVSGATGKDFDLLSERAREMGSKTSFSATEAADGLQYMALAGWDTQQMLGGIEPVLHLAEAGALDLGRASDLVTDSMSALGLEVKDLPGYLNKVAQTSRKSNTNMDALMEAMNIAGGTFSRFNVPLEEANAFLGVLANRGTKASEAGTAVNAIMDRLTSGTGQASKALEKLGISAFDSEGNFKGMETVMREINDALSGMTDEQKAHYQSMIAGLNHGKSFEKMLQGLDGEYDELKESIKNSDGALKDMRDTMKDNLQGAVENLGSAFEEIMISLGTALLPAIKALTGWIQQLADWFNGLSETTKRNLAIFMALSSILLIVGGGLLLLIGFLPNVLSGFLKLGTVVKGVGLAFTGATLPMLALIAVIGLVVASVVQLWKTNEEFRDNITTIWNSIKEIVTSVFEAIMPGVQAFIAGLLLIVQALMPVVSWVVNAVASFLSWIATVMETHSWITSLITTLAVIAGVVGTVIVAVATLAKIFAIVTTVVKVLGAIFAIFTGPVGIVIAIVGVLAGVFIGLWKVLQWLGEKFEWLGNLMDTVSNFMSNAWDKFLGLFGGGTKEAADEASESIEGVSEKGKEDLSGLSESGVASMDALNAGVTGNIGQMSEESGNMIGQMQLNGITDFQNLNASATAETSAMGSNVTGDISAMTGDASSLLADLEKNGSIDMSSLNTNVSSEMSGMSADVLSEVGNMGTSASSNFGSMAKDINAEMGKVRTITSGAMEGVSHDFSKGLKEASNVVRTSFKSISTVIKTGMKSVVMSVKVSTASIVSSVRRLSIHFRSAGVQAMRGLRSGLNSGASSVIATANRIANQVSATIKSALKIHSPSRVLKKLGVYTVQGFEVGMVSMVDRVSKTSDMLADAAKPDLSQVSLSYATPSGVRSSSLSSAVNGTVDVNGRDDMLAKAIDGLRRDLTNLRVEMEGETVGRIVRPHINESNAVEASVRRYFD